MNEKHLRADPDIVQKSKLGFDVVEKMRDTLRVHTDLQAHFNELLSYMHLEIAKCYSMGDPAEYNAKVQMIRELEDTIRKVDLHSCSAISQLHQLQVTDLTERPRPARGFPKQ